MGFYEKPWVSYEKQWVSMKNHRFPMKNHGFLGDVKNIGGNGGHRIVMEIPLSGMELSTVFGKNDDQSVDGMGGDRMR